MPEQFRHLDEVNVIARKAGADLRLSQYRGVARNGAGEIVRAGAGDSYGVLENDPNIGQQATVFIGGCFPMVAGAIFSRDAKLTTDAAGRAAVAGAGASYQYRAEGDATAVDQITTVRRETGQA
jgi:hypothetical protein